MLALSILFACDPSMPDATPRTAGIDSRAFVGEAELVVRYRYAPLPRYEVELFVDLAALEGEVGEVSVEVQPQDLDVVRGPLQWNATLGRGAEHSKSVLLRAGGKSSPRATIVTRKGGSGAELARDTLRFVIDEEAVRECRATDPCGS